MKQAKKFLTLILTITVLASSFVFNAFAVNSCDYDSTLSSAPIRQNSGRIALFSRANSINVKHNNTIDDIVEKEKEFSHNGFNGDITRYNEIPNFSSPYYAGSLNSDDIEDAENAMKMVRYLAGVPYEDVCFRDDLNNIAQHGAVLLAASDQFSHYPIQPNDMDDAFYELGYRGCNEANIYAGISNISYGVLGWVYDDGANNIERAGHRRWILNPGNQNFGIGFAKSNTASYGGYRANMHVFDGMGPWDCESDSYISWPNAGDFPIQYFVASQEYSNMDVDCPWSINLGEPYETPNRDDIVLKLTRQRDNKIWIFNSDTPNLGEEGLSDNKLHLSVDSDGYGIRKAIIFRPDVTSLGTIRDGDIFTVELSGIKYTNGASATLKYDINFFDLSKEMNRSRINIIVKHNNAPIENAQVKIDGQTLVTDSNGLASLRVANNKKYDYTVLKSGYNTETGTISVANSEVNKTIEATMPVSFEISETSKSYNGIGQGVVVNASPEIEYMVTYNGSTDVPIAAGKYDVVVKANQQGYSGQQIATLTISKADITVTANNIQKREGTDDPALTYEYIGTLYGEDEFTGELTRQSGEEIGTYDILQGTLDLSDNYNITYNKAVFEIVEKTPQNITVSDITEKTYGDSSFVVAVTPDSTSQLTAFTFESSNTDVAEIAADGTVTIKAAGETNITVKQAGNETYAAFTKTQKLVVKKVAITINADAKMKKVGAADPELTYQVVGELVNGDSITGSLARKPGEEIGQYDILIGTLDINNNYDITYNKAIFEIVDKTPQTITVAEFPSKTYGDDGFTIEVTADETSGLNTFTFSSSDETVAIVDENGAVTIVGAGKTEITISQAGNDEYAVANVKKEFIVNQKAVTVDSIDLENKTAELTGVIAGDVSEVTIDFSKLTIETVANNAENTIIAGAGYKADAAVAKATIDELTLAMGRESVDTPNVDIETMYVGLDNLDTEKLYDVKLFKGNDEITFKTSDNKVTGKTESTVYWTFNQSNPESTTIAIADGTYTAKVYEVAGDVYTEIDAIDIIVLGDTDVEAPITVKVTNLVLTGDKAANYVVATEEFETQVSAEMIVNVSVAAENGTVTGIGKYLKGSNVTVVATPNSGYDFSGWYVNDTSVSTETTYTFIADADTALVAKFARRSSGGGSGSTYYTVKFDTNDGTKVSDQRIKRNAVAKAPEAPTKDGFTFEGWYTDKELTKEYDFTTKVTKSITLYAKWAEVDKTKSQIILTIGNKVAKVFGEDKANDVAPKIVNDRTMLPARFVAESLGAKVEWDDTAPGIVTITKDDVKIVIYIGEDYAVVNGEKVKLDSPAFIENDRTYTPIRFISEELGAKVEWLPETQQVVITK